MSHLEQWENRKVMLERVKKLRENLCANSCDGFFSLNAAANQYLTGFRGSTSAVIVTRKEEFFFCDSRYTEQARAEVVGFPVEEISGDICVRVAERLQSVGCQVAAYEPESLTVGALRTLEKNYLGRLRDVPGVLSNLRRVKDENEIAAIDGALRIAESVLVDVLKGLAPGVTEREVAAKIDYEMKLRGAEAPSFDTIVLFGKRTSLPHGKPGDARLSEGDVVLLDFGCKWRGYCSDLTRTTVFGSMHPDWFGHVYQTVLNAQLAALAAAKAGMTCRELDAVARTIISEAGFGQYFGHGLGHGLGIEIHEAPRLNPQSEVVLEPGMVVTVEPGIYIPGQGGVRIEDVIVVTSVGCKVMTRASKELAR